MSETKKKKSYTLDHDVVDILEDTSADKLIGIPIKLSNSQKVNTILRNYLIKKKLLIEETN